MYTVLEVGKPFPGAHPLQQGAVMELTKSGLTVLIQYPNITQEELKAFKNSFSSYSYFEADTPIPIPIFVFPFPSPFGTIDVNLNARVVNATTISQYLSFPGNTIYFHVIDGNILKANKLVGLDPECVKLFQETLKKQLQREYRSQDFLRYLDGIYTFSSEELFKMGKIFQKTKPVPVRTDTPVHKFSETDIIDQCLKGLCNKSMRYHSSLPPELAKWYCYTIDGGHSILAILKAHYKDDMVFTDYLLPCPVKAVLSTNYEIKNGYVVVDLPYSTEVGLMTEPKYDEF